MMSQLSQFLAGHLLVAIPHLLDQNFFRSVVLVVEHSDKGAAGVILNRPSETTIASLWPSIAKGYCGLDDPIWLGGPVDGPVIALHQNRHLGEIMVLPDLFASSKQENLQLLVENVNVSNGQMKMFLGYSGWAGGQLEAEIEQGGWLSQPATTEHVFMDFDEMWKRDCDEIGDSILGHQWGGVPPTEPGSN